MGIGDVFEKFWETIVEPPDRHISAIFADIEEMPSKFGDWKRFDRNTADAFFRAMPPLVYELLDPKYTEEYHKAQMVIADIFSATIETRYVTPEICARFVLHCTDNLFALMHFWGEKNNADSIGSIDILADAVLGLMGRERYNDEAIEVKQTTLDHILRAVAMVTSEPPPPRLLAKMMHTVDSFKFLLQYKRIRVNTSKHTWPDSMMIIMKNMLCTSAHMIPLKLVALVFHVLGTTLYVLEEKWFKDDVRFFCLVTQLNTVQVRLCLDRPILDEHDRFDVAIYCGIAEAVMNAAEKEENAPWITDEIATKMACTIQEFATFVLKYWKEATEQNIAIDIELQGTFFTFFCELVKNDGTHMIDSDVTDAICILWASTFRRLLIDKNLDALRFIIAVLADIPKLPNDYPILVTSYAIQLVHGERKWMKKFDRLVKAVEILIARDDWYTKQTLESAIFMLMGEKKCRAILVLFETKMMWIEADEQLKSTTDCADTPSLEGLKIDPNKMESPKNEENDTSGNVKETSPSDDSTDSKDRADPDYSI